MAINLQYEGDVIPITESLLTHPLHSPDLAISGDPVLVGSITGVALNSPSAATGTVLVAVEGVWDLPATAVTASANSAIAIGDPLYYAPADIKAKATLTSDGTAPSIDDTVTIGSIEYKFKFELTTAPKAVPYEVLYGSSAAEALDNLKSAINGTTGEGSTYGTGTVAHPTFEATTNTNTTQLIVARTAGAAANSTVLTEASTHLAWDVGHAWGGVTKGELSKTSANTGVGLALETVTSGASDIINVLLKRKF